MTFNEGISDALSRSTVSHHVACRIDPNRRDDNAGTFMAPSPSRVQKSAFGSRNSRSSRGVSLFDDTGHVSVSVVRESILSGPLSWYSPSAKSQSLSSTPTQSHSLSAVGFSSNDNVQQRGDDAWAASPSSTPNHSRRGTPSSTPSHSRRPSLVGFASPSSDALGVAMGKIGLPTKQSTSASSPPQKVRTPTATNGNGSFVSTRSASSYGSSRSSSARRVRDYEHYTIAAAMRRAQDFEARPARFEATNKLLAVQARRMEEHRKKFLEPARQRAYEEQMAVTHEYERKARAILSGPGVSEFDQQFLGRYKLHSQTHHVHSTCWDLRHETSQVSQVL
eukprot:CAMPEP_0115856124 /NCGR_PEP_ID=MMETSP0287-20121206/14890_1 /TAXON_ID=412157 /ORGANISM="Chrysochromulina rotalis, Strain UIO044" /LENGTH=335 /DNA_ID=CAMNT_0003310287 /DNA_START=56 /DNA_END=1063 /DNA_ORIENTATION=+